MPSRASSWTVRRWPDPLSICLPQEQVRLEQARQLAKQNPIAVANIVKTWINGEAT